MGYDIHIIRTDDWPDAESNPITKEDVDRLLAADPDLQWSTADYVDMLEADGTIKHYYMILWKGEPVFWWYKGEITCARAVDSQVVKMVQMARVLGARVVGDDGERYELVKKGFGKEELFMVNAD